MTRLHPWPDQGRMKKRPIFIPVLAVFFLVIVILAAKARRWLVIDDPRRSRCYPRHSRRDPLPASSWPRIAQPSIRLKVDLRCSRALSRLSIDSAGTRRTLGAKPAPGTANRYWPHPRPFYPGGGRRGRRVSQAARRSQSLAGDLGFSPPARPQQLSPGVSRPEG